MPPNLPQPTEGFAWAQAAWGPVLRCAALLDVALHLFTTRHLELKEDGRETAAGWERIASAIGVSPAGLVRPRQVHGAAVIVASRGRPQANPAGEGDIVVTDDPETAVVVQAADCVPLLLADRQTGAVAAAHAGWRGTAAGVAPAAVAALRTAFGADPAELVAAIGPSIGPCCYAVGEELIEAFRQAGHGASDLARWFSRDAALRLNLWKANRDQLEAAGLRPDQIHGAGLCTATHGDLFHSYRRDGKAAGRLAAAIRPRG